MAIWLPPYVAGSDGYGRTDNPSSVLDKPATIRDKTISVAASGTLAALLYGPFRFPASIFVEAQSNNQLIVGACLGIGQINSIDTVYIDGVIAPVGVEINTYLGTPDQGVDPFLASAIAGYSDNLVYDSPRSPAGKNGVAYIVIRANTDVLPDYPVNIYIEGTGKLLFDPRTGTTGYSNNPALVMRDIITNPDYGLDMPAYGIEDCANWCDEETAVGFPRARLSLMVTRSIETTQLLTLVANHAECFWYFNADGVATKPDKPVDLDNAIRITSNMILEESLQITGETSLNSPTEIEVNYTDQGVGQGAWTTTPATPARLPGVDEGVVPRIPESYTMEATYREPEAALKARGVLARKQHVVSASWTTRDLGITYEKGDIVVISIPEQNVNLPILIMEVNLISPGRYQIQGERYDESHYPSDAVVPPDDDVYLPAGCICILSGNSIPSGWVDFPATPGYFLIGAGDLYNPGQSGNGSGQVSQGGMTTTGGEHTGPIDASVAFQARVGWENIGSGIYNVAETSAKVGGHQHAWTLTGTPIPRRLNVRLVMKSTNVNEDIPPQIRLFGLGGIQNAYMQRIVENTNHPLCTATSYGTVSAPSLPFQVVPTNDAHRHNLGNYALWLPGGGMQWPTQTDPGGGNHAHEGTVSLDAELRRRALAMYGSSIPFKITPGMIVMWSGSLSNIPTGWVLCDGNNGTPDMRNQFLAVAASGQEGQLYGDNRFTKTLPMNSVGHAHGSGFENIFYYPGYIGHTNEITHTHSLYVSQEWLAPFLALPFIMYNPRL